MWCRSGREGWVRLRLILKGEIVGGLEIENTEAGTDNFAESEFDTSVENLDES